MNERETVTGFSFEEYDKLRIVLRGEIIVPMQNNSIELLNPNYVPIMKDHTLSYGGSQMWFTPKSKWTRDYVIQTYGCGTIATADFILYLTLQNQYLMNSITETVLANSLITSQNYINYVKKIDDQFTKTHRIFAVFGNKIASSINAYSKKFHLGYHAAWKTKLTYYDMFDMIEEMLLYDIPVIISIGPNIPLLWGSNGITFYERKDIIKQPTSEDEGEILYQYQPVKYNVHSHYVNVTGLIYGDFSHKVMLRISSWGTQYYIDYEEYREYIDEFGSKSTSSMVYVSPF